VRLRKEKAVELLGRHDIAFTDDPAVEPAGSLLVAADPASHKILVLLSKKTVDEWGELCAQSPRDVAREFLEPGEHAHGHTARELARRAGFCGSDQGRLQKLVLGAHRVFAQNDCVWVGLHFARCREGIAVTRSDLEIDESAIFRHPELKSALEPAPERERSEREKSARALGIEYLDLDGDLGILPGGIGFGMAAVDIVTNTGGFPADVMDSGGESSTERLRAMMDLMLDNPKVSVAFCCRYAGLTRADAWARQMVQYLLEKKTAKPVVLRVAGNDEEAARKLFEEAAAASPEVFKRVWTFFSTTPADNAAREAVALAEMLRKGEDPFAEAEPEPAEAKKAEAAQPAAPSSTSAPRAPATQPPAGNGCAKPPAGKNGNGSHMPARNGPKGGA
jgi:succinyl-CoA synthetase beta subunit